MIKIIDWKINIPLTGYAIQHYHCTYGEFQNSSLHDASFKRKPAVPLDPIV